MPLSLYAAGGLALVSGFLFWRLRVAHQNTGKLKAKNAQLQSQIKALVVASDLSKDRIRDLTGIDPDRLHIDETGGIWAE